jgi:Zn-dependent peptidase ImmA (M78 family)/transcriptional regulator with XRE-family HTH domain
MTAALRREIPFNKSVLKWARERRGRSYEDAATSAGVRPEKVAEWEDRSASSLPSVRQARLLAAAYGRPFLEFLAAEIPILSESPLVPDFRLGRSTPGPEDHIGLAEVQSWAESLRLNAIDLLEMLGDQIPRFRSDLHATVVDSFEDMAWKVRLAIGFTPELQIGLPSKERDNVPQVLRKKIERAGVLVVKSSALNEFSARGMCMYADALPIVIFGGEAFGAQAFTMAHELAHVVLSHSAVSDGLKGPGTNRIEQWCNDFAGAFLIPKPILVRDLDHLQINSPSIDDFRLKSLAARYAVSRHAMLVRLVKLGYVRKEYYWGFKRQQFIAEEDSHVAQGRSKYYGSRYRNSCGDFYTGLVLEAWSSGHITNHNAAEFLGIKNITHLNDIRSNFEVRE